MKNITRAKYITKVKYIAIALLGAILAPVLLWVALGVALHIRCRKNSPRQRFSEILQKVGTC
jgi:hypothetical protein